MREDLLHFIWKYKKLQLTELTTSKDELVTIVDVGQHNHLAGPDFFNSKIDIDGQLWAGNVELHLKSSAWYAHRHEKDPNYDNVILHVVWEDDAAVFRKDGSEIPTLELKDYIPESLLKTYQNLFATSKKGFINCENEIATVDSFLKENWFERLYFERLERKSDVVLELLDKSNNDWEKVFFTLLLKNFGLNINGEAFMGLASALDFSIVRKTRHDTLKLESVLYGLTGLLSDADVVDTYYKNLQREYDFLRTKYELDEVSVRRPEFFKLRPPNFPTIRLSQLANLYARHQNIFSKVVEANTLKALYDTFEVGASSYWDTHFTFGKESKRSVKNLTRKFIDLLIINTVLPLKFCYAKNFGKDADEEIIAIISQVKQEVNSVVGKFEDLGVGLQSAKGSQAALQLYNEYCTQNKCLQCAIGNSLLQGND